MATLRVRHTKNYTCISNKAIRDKSLSFKARGIHHILLSFPDEWVVNTEQLIGHSDKDGRDAIAAGLRELEKAGYIKRQRSQDPKTGKWQWESVVSETPIDGLSVDGLSVDGLSVDGLSVDGLSVDGKPVDIRSNVFSSTVFSSTEKKEVLCEESKIAPKRGKPNQNTQELFDFVQDQEIAIAHGDPPKIARREDEYLETGKHTKTPSKPLVGDSGWESEPIEAELIDSLSCQSQFNGQNGANGQDRYSAVIAVPVCETGIPVDGVIEALMAIAPDPSSREFAMLPGTIKTELRFNPARFYPWKKDPDTMKLFIEFLINKSMGVKLDKGDRRNIAEQWICKANNAPPVMTNASYIQVWRRWQKFVECASTATNAVDLTKRESNLSPEVQELFRKRGIA